MKISIFILLALLLLPLVSAQIVLVKVSGDDGIEGFRRAENDRTIVTVDSQIPQDTSITPRQLSVISGGATRAFSRCEDHDGLARCTYQSSIMSITPNSYPLTIVLKDDAGRVIDLRTVRMETDTQKPVITVNRAVYSANTTTISFTVSDSSCPSCTACSGIKNITVGLKSISPDGCMYEGTETIPRQDFSITAVDGVGNRNTLLSSSISIDSTLPAIDASTLRFFQGNDPLRIIGASATAVRVTIDVAEENLALVHADFSALSPLYAELYSKLPATCVRMTSGLYRCTWNNIVIHPATANPQITISAVDISGLESSTTLPFALQKDTDAPEIVSIETTGCYEGKCYASAENNIIKVILEESGSGFHTTVAVNGKPAYSLALDLHEMSSTLRTVYASNCTAIESNRWACFFRGLPADGPHGRTFTIRVLEGSKDDAGNRVKGETTAVATVDLLPPSIEGSIAITSSTEKIKLLLEGMPLNIQARVQDDSHVLTRVRSPSILSDAAFFTQECKTTDSLHDCTFDAIETIGPGPLLGAEIELEFIDMAGNKLSRKEQATIVIGDNVSRQYWSVASAKPSPDRLNKDTLFVPQHVFFDVRLSASNSIELLDTKIQGCTGDTQYILEAPTLLHETDRGVVIRVDVAPFAESLPEITTITLQCSLDILSLVQKQRITPPQLLPVTLVIPLASSSLGGAGENVKDLLNDAKNYKIGALNDMVGVMAPFIEQFEKMCLLSKTQANLGGISGGIGSAFSLGSPLLYPPYGSTPQNQFSQNPLNAFALQQQQQQLVGNNLGQYCQYITCDKGMWDNALQSIGEDNGLLPEPEFSKERHLGMTPWPQNPRNSLVLSVATGCLPGIIHNLRVYKEIHCQYADCLQNQVPQGISLQYCQDQFHYLECRYVYGQYFEVIPYAHFIKRMGTYMKTILANPATLVLGAGSLCKNKVAFVELPDALCDISSAIGSFGTLQQDFAAVSQTQGFLGSPEPKENICEKVGFGSGVS